MITEKEERIARTESVFRYVNERIAETSERFDTADGEFVCECADAECYHRIEAPLEDYEQIRNESTTFLVADGHELPEYESVRERRRGYMVIEKMTHGIRLAVRRTDPRAETA